MSSARRSTARLDERGETGAWRIEAGPCPSRPRGVTGWRRGGSRRCPPGFRVTAGAGASHFQAAPLRSWDPSHQQHQPAPRRRTGDPAERSRRAAVCHEEVVPALPAPGPGDAALEDAAVQVPVDRLPGARAQRSVACARSARRGAPGSARSAATAPGTGPCARPPGPVHAGRARRRHLPSTERRRPPAQRWGRRRGQRLRRRGRAADAARRVRSPVDAVRLALLGQLRRPSARRPRRPRPGCCNGSSRPTAWTDEDRWEGQDHAVFVSPRSSRTPTPGGRR